MNLKDIETEIIDKRIYAVVENNATGKFTRDCTFFETEIEAKIYCDFQRYEHLCDGYMKDSKDEYDRGNYYIQEIFL